MPPILVSTAMMIWPPDLERMKNSALGNYISKYMTPTIEAIRLLSLVPMAWGAWIHNLWLIALGLLILSLAWGNGLNSPPAWLKLGGYPFLEAVNGFVGWPRELVRASQPRFDARPRQFILLNN